MSRQRCSDVIYIPERQKCSDTVYTQTRDKCIPVTTPNLLIFQDTTENGSFSSTATIDNTPLVTWNPSDKSSYLTLSNGNLQATISQFVAGSMGSLVRATHPFTQPSWFSVTSGDVWDGAAYNMCVGVVSASHATGGPPGAGLYGAGVMGDGRKWVDGTGPSAFSTWLVTDNNSTILIEFTGSSIKVYFNNTLKGTIALNMAQAPYYPAASLIGAVGHNYYCVATFSGGTSPSGYPSIGR